MPLNTEITYRLEGAKGYYSVLCRLHPCRVGFPLPVRQGHQLSMIRPTASSGSIPAGGDVRVPYIDTLAGNLGQRAHVGSDDYKQRFPNSECKKHLSQKVMISTETGRILSSCCLGIS